MKKLLLIPMIYCVCLYSHFEFSYKINGFATHQPVLYEITMRTKGPIIEFGCGDGSTKLLHEICKRDHRLLISIDDNREWFDKCRNQFIGDGYAEDNSGWHQFYFVEGKKDNLNPEHWIKFLQNFEPLQTVDFDICFVDQSPWLARHETIKLMKNRARYIVLHDCDYFPHNNIFGKEIRPIDIVDQIAGVYDFSDQFKYFEVYFPKKPWVGITGQPTLIGSNFESTLIGMDYSAY